MNFSEEKNKEFNKKVTSKLYEVSIEDSEGLIQKLLNCEKLKSNVDLDHSETTRIRIRDVKEKDGYIFTSLTIYEKTASVSVTPINNDDSDLYDIENYDKCHIFMTITDENLFVILQIDTKHPLSKLRRVFHVLGVDVIVSEKLNQDVVGKITKDGIRSISLSVETTKSDLEQVTASSNSLYSRAKQQLATLFEKEEDDDEEYYGLLTFDRKHNPSLISKANLNPSGIVGELSEQFFITTTKGQVIKCSQISTQKDYFTRMYGSSTIKSENAEEILVHYMNYII